MAAHLRVYSTRKALPAKDAQAATICVCLADLLPLLAEAKGRDFAWLNDFLEDEVVITPDLFDVLQAFCEHRPSA